MGPKAGRSASGMCSGALLWKLLAGHLGYLPPKDLTAPRTLGLQAACDYLPVPHASGCDGHMSLALFAPMLEGVEQPGIHSCQASQVLGIDLVGLAFALA